MKFIHIRPPFRLVPFTDKEGKTRQGKVYDNTSAVTIAYRILPADDDGQWLAIGAVFCSPKEKSWSRKQGCSIAGMRLKDSPLRLQFEGLEAELTSRHVLIGLRAIVIEKPEWGYIDEQVLRPDRFDGRWGAPLMGPDGSLLTAYIDGKQPSKEEEEENIVELARVLEVPEEEARDRYEEDWLPSHWSRRIPSFARALLLGE